jgi:murein DD-endopeptidase MepM/ murein hydrolase activator NlpD
MKALLTLLAASLFGAACSGPVSTLVPTASQTSTVITPTRTRAVPVPTDTTTPTRVPSQTSTVQPCDPLEAYCVESGHFLLDIPIAPPGTVTIDRVYAYGSTELGQREPHHGVEFNNAFGTPVLAAADGTAVAAGDDTSHAFAAYTNTYGKLVVLEHHFEGIPATIYTLYGHLSEVEIRPGQTVRAGEEIGKVGSSGAAIGSHLHFEVRQGQDDYDSNRNPVLWLKPLLDGAGKAKGVLAGRLEDPDGKPIYTDGINIQYFQDRKGAQTTAWQVETYAPEKHPVGGDDRWQENFTLGDLAPGDYRFTLMWGGKLYERWLAVKPGSLTYFVVRVDQ